MAKNARYVEYANTRILGILTDVYAGFFSDQEIEDMVNNQKDWYMTGEEVMARLQQREQYFIEKEKALLEAQAPSKPTKRGVKK